DLISWRSIASLVGDRRCRLFPQTVEHVERADLHRAGNVLACEHATSQVTRRDHEVHRCAVVSPPRRVLVSRLSETVLVWSRALWSSMRKASASKSSIGESSITLSRAGRSRQSASCASRLRQSIASWSRKRIASAGVILNWPGEHLSARYR